MPSVSPPALIALAAAALAGALPSAAQERPTVLEGVVADSATGRPVAGVLVRLDSGRGTVSDEFGHFRMVGVESGERLVALLTPDCHVSWHTLALRPGESRLVALTVRLDPRITDDGGDGRRGGAQGVFLDAAEIDALQATSLLEILRRVAPRMVGGAPEQAGGTTGLRGRTTNSFRPTDPVVVVDGIRVSDGGRALDQLSPSDVARLEVLPGAAAGWEFGSDGAAGVIRVTTRDGDRREAPEPVAGCRVPDFPTG